MGTERDPHCVEFGPVLKSEPSLLSAWPVLHALYHQKPRYLHFFLVILFATVMPIVKCYVVMLICKF